MVAGPRRDAVVLEQLDVQPGHRVLDIGCGSGDVLQLMPSTVAYVGVDASKAYIEAARKRFWHRGEFQVFEVGSHRWSDLGRFDRVLADGVLHHLDDPTAKALLVLAAAVLEPSGCVVTIDPCFVEGHGWFARRLLEADRGAHVRTTTSYLDIARAVFTDVRSDFHADLLRIPYSHLLTVCRCPMRESSADDVDGVSSPPVVIS